MRRGDQIRELLLFGVVAILHLVVTIGLVFYVFGSGMARFDTGAAPGMTEQMANWALIVLGFPC